MPLKDRHGIFPPGGFTFMQGETGWHAPPGLRFNECVDAIIKHRQANPRHNLPTDFRTVADVLDTYTCHRIKFDPHYCFVETVAQKKIGLPESVGLKLSKASVPAVKLAGVISSSVAGANILTDWLGHGGVPVPTALSEARARVCLPCPFNLKGNWKTRVNKEVAKAILEHLRVKEKIVPKLPDEEKLGMCNTCLCYLPLKVHVPLPYILEHTSEEILKGFHPDCWILSELKHKPTVQRWVKSEQKSILVTIPFWKGDVHQVEKLLSWIVELGGCKSHECLLVVDLRISHSWLRRIHELASAAFSRAHISRPPYQLEDETWPIGPNWMFKCALEEIHYKFQRPFFWMEPDCVPLKKDWLKQIQAEYVACGKPFMGFIVPAQDGYNAHLTGCAVYPGDASDTLLPYVTTNSEDSHLRSKGVPKAWDVVAGPVVIPQTHHTDLYYHLWGQWKLPPTFRRYLGKDDPENTVALSSIPKSAVIMHRNKDGTLINLLREDL